MRGFPLGKCQSCDAPVSYFSRFCPYCHAPNQPNPVTTIAALLAIILIGGSIALAAHAFRSKEAPQSASVKPDAPPASAATDDKAADYDWIVQAMAECEAEAKLELDTLHFLVVPVTTTGMSLPGWSPTPLSTIGNSGALLSSSDALIGLRNRALILYPKPLTFAVSDPGTQTVYKWKPAVGVAALKTRQTGFESLKLGFELPDAAPEIEWGPTVGIQKGTCYWINPLIRAATRSG